MVPPNVRPVIYKLVLHFLLIEGTVTLVGAERISEVKARRAIDEQGRHAGGESLIQIQVRDSRVSRGLSPEAVRIDEHTVAHPSEPEVSQQIRAQRVIEPRRQAM